MSLLHKKYSYLLAFLAIIVLFFCTPDTIVYSTVAPYQLVDSNLVAVCLPLKRIYVEYNDNTKLKPDSQFADSFLLEAANGFLLYEAMRSFKIAPRGAVAQKSIEQFGCPGFSVLKHDTALLPEVSKRIRDLAVQCSVDVVVFPYSCTIKQTVMQPKGWRNRGGPGYERPVLFSAATSFQVQIWSRRGHLLYERIGRSDAGKPLFYSFLKKDKPDGDLVEFAKKMYAPPLIKSLYSSIKRAMLFN
jgi:hypothetical protein